MGPASVQSFRQKAVPVGGGDAISDRRVVAQVRESDDSGCSLGLTGRRGLPGCDLNGLGQVPPLPPSVTRHRTQKRIVTPQTRPRRPRETDAN
jgi:hypothetical protein